MKYTLELIDGEYVNRAAAINALNLYRWHRRGQPVIVIYSDGNETKKAIFAIGIKSSNTSSTQPCGLNCYVIIGDGYNITNNIETIDIDNDTIQYNDNDQISVNVSALYEAGDGITFTPAGENRYIISANIDNDTITFDSSGRLVARVGSGGGEYVAGEGIEIDQNNVISAITDGDTIYINDEGQLSAELMERITWRNLKDLRDNSRLVPGKQYRIIDYTCETTQENTRSAHHDFDIIVFADSESQLNENARAIQREDLDINALTVPFSYETPYFQTNKKGVIYYFVGYTFDHGTVDPTVYEWRRCNVNNVQDSTITNDWGYPQFVYTYTSNPSGVVYKDYNNGTLSNPVDNAEVIYSTITDVPKIEVLQNTANGYNPTSLRAYYTGVTEEINGTTFYRFNWLSYNYKMIRQTYIPSPDDTCVLDYITDDWILYDLYMLSDTPATTDDRWLYMPDVYEGILGSPQQSVFESIGWFNPDYTNLINLKYIQEMRMTMLGYWNDIPSSLQPSGYVNLPVDTVTCNYEFINGQTHIESSDYFTNSKLESWKLKYCLDNDQHRFLWASPETIERDGKWYTMDVFLWTYTEKGQSSYLGKTDGYAISMRFNPFDFVSINSDVYMRWEIIDWAGSLPAVSQDGYIYTPYSSYYWNFTSPYNGLFDNQLGILIYDGNNYVDIYNYYVTQEGWSFSGQDVSAYPTQDHWQFNYVGDDPGTGYPIYSCNGIEIIPTNNPYDHFWTMHLNDLVTGNDNLYQYIEMCKGSGKDVLYDNVEYGEEHIYILEGKGVVYYMQDEWNNEAPYDFKSIKYGIGAVKKETVYKCQIYSLAQVCNIYTDEYSDKPGTLIFNKQCVSTFPPVMIDGQMYLVFEPDPIVLSGFGSDITISIPDNKLYVPYPYNFTADSDGILSQSMMFVYDTGQMITFETYLAQYLVQYGLTYTFGNSSAISWDSSGTVDIELYAIEDGITVTIDDIEYEAFYIDGNPNSPYIFINGDGELCLYNDYNQASELLTIPHFWDTGDKLIIYDAYAYYIEYSDKAPRTYVYTFNNDIYGVNTDHSLGYMIQENWMSLCFENVIKEYHNDQLESWVKYITGAGPYDPPYNFSLQVLNKNVFLNVDFNRILPRLAEVIDPAEAGGYFTELMQLLCIGNKLDANCHDNIFGSNCIMNIMEGNCIGNTLNNYCKVNTFGNNCSSNVLQDSCSQNKFDCECLHNILCTDSDYNTFGQGCESNTLDTGCTHNTFGQGCSSNNLCSGCKENIFGQGCSSNYLSSGCTHNTFGQGCTENTLDTSCTHNTFGQGCSSNNLGSDCKENIFGQGCSSNIMGNITDGGSCSHNVLGSGCKNNIFRYKFSKNQLGNLVSNNVFELSIESCVFENGVSYNVFGYNANINTDPTQYDASNYADIENMHVYDGVKYCYVTSSDPTWPSPNKLKNCQIMPGTQHPSTGTILNIVFPVAGASYTQIAGYNSSNVLTYKNPMD